MRGTLRQVVQNKRAVNVSGRTVYCHNVHIHNYGALVAVWVECRICNREVAGSNLGLGYFAPRSTQPSIPPGSVNEYTSYSWEGKGRYG